MKGTLAESMKDSCVQQTLLWYARNMNPSAFLKGIKLIISGYITHICTVHNKICCFFIIV